MKLSRESKALIFGLKPPPNTNNTDTRKSMFHNLSAFDFINKIDDTYPNDQRGDIPNTDGNNTLLANFTSI